MSNNVQLAFDFILKNIDTEINFFEKQKEAVISFLKSNNVKDSMTASFHLKISDYDVLINELKSRKDNINSLIDVFNSLP